MPSEFFRTSTTWVVDFRYEGHPRRWFKVFGRDIDVRASMAAELHQLYGDRVQMVEVRKATDQEEGQYLRGDEPKNAFCPTGRRGPDAGAIGVKQHPEAHRRCDRSSLRGGGRATSGRDLAR